MSDGLRKCTAQGAAKYEAGIWSKHSIAIGFIWGFCRIAGLDWIGKKGGGEPSSRGAVPAAPLR
jgi:hypothetical protein